MVEKDDLQYPGGYLRLPQRQVLLGLSSGLPDRVPTLEIAISRLRLTNDAGTIKLSMISLFRSLTVSAPPDRKKE